MRRADRLFRLVQALRGGRLHTARRLAELLEVSERTVYRDIRDLQGSGVPIDGEAGVGYVMRGFDLPPLMFSHAEVEALVLGARMVEAWGGAGLARAAREALDKIEAVLPAKLGRLAAQTHLYAPGFHVPGTLKGLLDSLTEAVQAGRWVDIAYQSLDDVASHRRVRPLGLYFWGGVWTLAAWCELRSAFRSFRIDRIEDLIPGEGLFPIEEGRTLADFLTQATNPGSLGGLRSCPR